MKNYKFEKSGRGLLHPEVKIGNTKRLKVRELVFISGRDDFCNPNPKSEIEKETCFSLRYINFILINSIFFNNNISSENMLN